MIARRTYQGWIVLIAVLVAAGCSGNNARSPKHLFNPFPGGTDLASRDGAAETPQPSLPDETPGLEVSSLEVSDPGSGQEAPEAKLSGSLAIAKLAERRGQTKQAEQLYQTLLEKEPHNHVEIYHRLAVMGARQGRFDLAEERFAKALELAPGDPDILCDLGYCYYLQQRLDDAEVVLNRAKKIEPNNPSVCNNLALLYGEQRRYAESLFMFKRNCSDAEAYANLAFIYTQHGDLEKAKQAYSQALTLDRQLRPAAEAMVQLARTESMRQELAALDLLGPAATTSSNLAQTIPVPQPSQWPSAASSQSQINQASFHADVVSPEPAKTYDSPLP